MNGRLRAIGIVLAVQRLDVVPEDSLQDLEDPLDIFLVGVVKIRGHQRQLLIGKQRAAEIQNEDLLLILPEQLVLDVDQSFKKGGFPTHSGAQHHHVGFQQIYLKFRLHLDNGDVIDAECANHIFRTHINTSNL